MAVKLAKLTLGLKLTPKRIKGAFREGISDVRSCLSKSKSLFLSSVLHRHRSGRHRSDIFLNTSQQDGSALLAVLWLLNILDSLRQDQAGKDARMAVEEGQVDNPSAKPMVPLLRLLPPK